MLATYYSSLSFSNFFSRDIVNMIINIVIVIFHFFVCFLQSLPLIVEQTLRNLQGLHLDDKKGDSFIRQSPVKSNVAKGITLLSFFFQLYCKPEFFPFRLTILYRNGQFQKIFIPNHGRLPSFNPP